MLSLTNDVARRKEIEAYLDAGHGSCDLRDERIARLVEENLLHFDDQRYRLLAWVIMPNHVHVLIETFPGYPLDKVVHAWKSYTAKEANKILGRTGDFWQPEYFDRYIRDEGHFNDAVRYIHENPVKAGLVTCPEAWRFSSARRETAGEPPALPGGALPGFEKQWKGAAGLAADVRYYGKWMRDEAEKRIGHLYPKVKLPKEYGGGEATVIAWLWARTVKCPNPACGAQIPLVRSFWLSKKRGKKSWVVPYHSHGEIHFKVETGEPTEKLVETIESGAGFLNSKGKKVKAMFRCITCKEGNIKGDYIDHEANQGRMSYLPLAIVTEGKRG